MSSQRPHHRVHVLRRPDRDPETLGQVRSGRDVAHQYPVLVQQAPEHLAGRQRETADENEVGRRWIDAERRNAAQPGERPVAGGDDLRHVRLRLRVREQQAGRGERQRVHVVRELGLGDFPRDSGVRQRESEPQAGEPEGLGECPEDHHPGRDREETDGRRTAELLIGLVADHERVRGRQHALHRIGRERAAGRVVGRVEHHDSRALAGRHLDERVDLVAEVRAEGHRHVSPAEHAREQPVERERRRRGDHAVSAVERYRERRLDQLVRAVADEDSVRRPVVAGRERLEQRSRRELRIPVPRNGGEPVGDLPLERRRNVVRALVLVELAPEPSGS